MLNYLDRVQEQVGEIAIPRRSDASGGAARGACGLRPELLKGENRKAAALRGVMLVCAVVLSKTGKVGQDAVAAGAADFSPSVPGEQPSGVHQ